MSMDDEGADDLQPVTWVPISESPGQLPLDRLDYGDAEQLAEMATPGEPTREEPREMVDAPVQIQAPYDRPRKRRNQRPLPT